MKRNAFILRLICIMCATLLLCGIFAACGTVEPQPTDAPTQAPTGGPTEEPTQEPTKDNDSLLMDGEDHVEMPYG